MRLHSDRRRTIPDQWSHGCGQRGSCQYTCSNSKKHFNYNEFEKIKTKHDSSGLVKRYRGGLVGGGRGRPGLSSAIMGLVVVFGSIVSFNRVSPDGRSSSAPSVVVAAVSVETSVGVAVVQNNTLDRFSCNADAISTNPIQVNWRNITHCKNKGNKRKEKPYDTVLRVTLKELESVGDQRALVEAA